MKLIAGSSNPPLCEEISAYLDTPLTEMSTRRFLDEEIFVEILENVRGEDCFLIQSTNNPANDNLMELLITIDALRRGSARRITAVVPYYGYARQDRKTGPRTPISAKLVANLITKAGADRVLTIDLHAGQIQGFFDVPTDNLYAAPLFVDHIKKTWKECHDVVIVSPDVGGVTRARNVAARLNCEIAIIDKRRPRANVSEVMNVIGDVEGRHCLVVDDLIDSAGTLCQAAQALNDYGALSVAAYASHGVLSEPALKRITNSHLSNVVITNSIRQPWPVQHSTKIEVLDVSHLLGEAIRRITESKSISILFSD